MTVLPTTFEMASEVTEVLLQSIISRFGLPVSLQGASLYFSNYSAGGISFGDYL
jgi:hypothetical protein